MRVKKNLLAVVAVFVCCLAVVWLSTSIQGSQRKYEVHPQITVPEYRSDAARAIDAYERLMERYMDLTERNSFRFGTDIQDAMRKLDSIDNKLTELAERMERIEKALGIEQSLAPIEGEPEPISFDEDKALVMEG